MEAKEIYELLDKIRSEVKEDFERLENKADKIYVKVEAFEPVRKVVYGLIGLILTAVILALIGMVVSK